MVLVKVCIAINSQRKQIAKPLFKKTPQVKPRIGQERAGSRWKKPPINQLVAESAENSKIPMLPKIPTEVINMPNLATPVQSISNPSPEAINRKNDAANKQRHSFLS